MSKFTLRDLFALITIVALALGWWLDHRRQALLHAENQYLRMQVEVLAAELKQHGLTVTHALRKNRSGR